MSFALWASKMCQLLIFLYLKIKQVLAVHYECWSKELLCFSYYVFGEKIKDLNKAISFIKYKSFFLLPGCFRATTDKSPFSRNVRHMETETKPRQHWTRWAESKNKDSSFSRESVLTRTNQGYTPGKLSAKSSIYESFKNSPDNPRVYIGVKAQPWLYEAVPDERLSSPVTVSLSVLTFLFLLINL